MTDNRGNPRKQRPRSPLGLPGQRRGRPVKQLAFWVVLFLILLLSFQHYYYGKPRHEQISFSQFLAEVDEGNIAKLTFIEKEIEGELARERMMPFGVTTKPVRHFRTVVPFEDPELLTRIVDANRDVVLEAKQPQANWLGATAPSTSGSRAPSSSRETVRR
jgi:ATP-dependent Zn protease